MYVQNKYPELTMLTSLITVSVFVAAVIFVFFPEYSVPSPNTYVLPDAFKDAPQHSMTYRAFETEGTNKLCLADFNLFGELFLAHYISSSRSQNSLFEYKLELLVELPSINKVSLVQVCFCRKQNRFSRAATLDQ